MLTSTGRVSVASLGGRVYIARSIRSVSYTTRWSSTLSRSSHDVIYFCRANVGFNILEGGNPTDQIWARYCRAPRAGEPPGLLSGLQKLLVIIRNTGLWLIEQYHSPLSLWPSAALLVFTVRAACRCLGLRKAGALLVLSVLRPADPMALPF
jgi:hypothetical protein